MYRSYRITNLVLFPHARLKKCYAEKLDTFYGCMQVYYSLIYKTLAAKKKCLHSNFPKILCCMVIGLKFCLRLKVNYYIQNQTIGIRVTVWIASLPYTSFCHGHNWTTCTLAIQDSSRKTGRILTALNPAVCGEAIKTSNWMAMSANGETAHSSLLGWLQKQTAEPRG